MKKDFLMFFLYFIFLQTSVRIPPPQPISSNWKPFRGFIRSWVFDDDWRSCSRMNGIRSWLSECNAAYSPVSFHHADDNWRKRSISPGSTELRADNWRDMIEIGLGNNQKILIG